MSYMTKMLSVRLQPDVAARLRTKAEATGEPLSRLAQRLIDEGLRMAAYPGILFRDGPTGRRAALLLGPDVWEVISLLRNLEPRGQDAITAAAEHLGAHFSSIRAALAYYGEFGEEIDRDVAANDRALEKARASLTRQQELLSKSTLAQ